MDYEAVLFDMDGVIVNSESLHMIAFEEVLKKYGYDLTRAQYKQYFDGKTDEQGFREYLYFTGASASVAMLMSEKARVYTGLSTSQIKSYPGVVESILDLAGRGVLLAVVTGSLAVEVKVALEALGIEKAFSAVISAEDITCGKPDAEGYLKGADVLGVDPTNCIAVEDSPIGVAAAVSAGMRCIAITNTHSSQELAEATHILEMLQPSCFTDAPVSVTIGR